MSDRRLDKKNLGGKNKRKEKREKSAGISQSVWLEKSP
jgi:hypothetical protein